ncbi:uncharacterized protein Ga0609869_003028 [Rhodovulum iodosum]|uniref:DUF484 family protein n=1 Tax=Rhodovulum iodosum TaxID=68291 RepID=A0ABV3XWG9_9RHOB|nr:DUF484 family protein [Rhodovulum robiginosum]
MSSMPAIRDDLRARIIADPDVILEDPEVMRALVAANEKVLGGNIIDMRGIAMERLEARLDRLEETHRMVIAAAYENLAGTNQIHRAILRLLDPTDFEGFLAALGSEVADTLRVDCLRLILEGEADEMAGGLDRLGEVLVIAGPGFVEAVIGRGRGTGRAVTLRQCQAGDADVYGAKAVDIRSEALMRLDLGAGRRPAMLAMGAEDPHLFAPNQGTDLLAFFAGVFERAMRRWLS